MRKVSRIDKLSRLHPAHVILTLSNVKLVQNLNLFFWSQFPHLWDRSLMSMRQVPVGRTYPRVVSMYSVKIKQCYPDIVIQMEAWFYQRRSSFSAECLPCRHTSHPRTSFRGRVSRIRGRDGTARPPSCPGCAGWRALPLPRSRSCEECNLWRLDVYLSKKVLRFSWTISVSKSILNMVIHFNCCINWCKPN